MTTIVVGAGLAGLTCAAMLVAAGHDVLVIDKARSVGGRLATRRIGDATFDHGAQFFTTRSPEFTEAVERWTTSGLVTTWSNGFDDPPDGHPRYAVRGGMTALAKHLATGVPVRCAAMAFSLQIEGGRWRVVLDDASALSADALVLTCPVPQSYSLVIATGIELPPTLLRGEYDRTIALLARLDRSVDIGTAGALQNAHPVFSMIADNQSKGVSVTPAVTFHANPDWSLEHWDHPHRTTHKLLVDEAEQTLRGGQVVDSQVKRWRFATPRSIWPERCLVASAEPMLVLAGDAFGGPKVEGAYLSGRAAAAAIMSSSAS